MALSFDAGFVSFGASYARALKEDNEENRFILSASLPVGKDQAIPVTLKGKFGINDYTDNDSADDYNWYLVGIGTKIEGFGLDVFYTGRFYVDSDEDDPDAILGASISRSF